MKSDEKIIDGHTDRILTYAKDVYNDQENESRLQVLQGLRAAAYSVYGMMSDSYNEIDNYIKEILNSH